MCRRRPWRRSPRCRCRWPADAAAEASVRSVCSSRSNIKLRTQESSAAPHVAVARQGVGSTPTLQTFLRVVWARMQSTRCTQPGAHIVVTVHIARAGGVRGAARVAVARLSRRRRGSVGAEQHADAADLPAHDVRSNVRRGGKLEHAAARSGRAAGVELAVATGGGARLEREHAAGRRRCGQRVRRGARGVGEQGHDAARVD